jgi:hypothetical protein
MEFFMNQPKILSSLPNCFKFQDMNEFNGLQAKIWEIAMNGEKLTETEEKMNHKNGKIAGFLLEKIRVYKSNLNKF